MHSLIFSSKFCDFRHNFRQRHFFLRQKRDDNELKLVLNDKNYDANLLTFSSTNKNETKMLGRDDLGRD